MTKTQKDKLYLEKNVTNLLKTLGMPCHIKGYRYVKRGIVLIYQNPNIINNVMNELYFNIASEYNTTVGRVEGNIRHAIEISWNRGDWDTMNEIFGHSIDEEKAKPTNTQYMSSIAEKIAFEYNN